MFSDTRRLRRCGWRESEVQRRWKRSGWRLCRAGYRLDLIQYFLLLIHGIFLFSPCTHFSYQFEVHTHFHDQIRLCEQEIRLYELKSVFETYIYSLNGHLTRKSVYAESPLLSATTVLQFHHNGRLVTYIVRNHYEAAIWIKVWNHFSNK